MAGCSCFRSNTPRIVDETIDGETLIVDLVTGHYFSCKGASSVAWIALRHGASPHEVARLLASSYGVAATDVECDLEGFVAALLDDEVLTIRSEPPDPASEQLPALLTPTGDYEPPRLEKYTDLADLILLDPVHDVSVAGWPSRRE